MTEETTKRKRRSRALEVLEAQNAKPEEPEEEDLSEEEIGLLTQLMIRAGEHLPKTKP